MNNILLSICIPTYNRNIWLKKSLETLVPQLQNLENEVELIISNNASTDLTRQVINEYITKFPIIVNHNSLNVGGTKNFHICSQLARGKYVWTLGDDDFVVDKFIPKLLIIMKKNENIPFYYIQNVGWHPEEREIEDYLSDLSLLYNDFYSDSEIIWEKFEKLSIIAKPETGYFNAISNFIMLKEHCQAAFELGVKAGVPFTSIESIFSHSVYIANNLLYLPCIYISSPGTLGSTAVSWENYYEITYLKWYPELFILMSRNGADKAKSVDGRKALFSLYETMLLEALKGNIERSEYFSFRVFTLNNFRFRAYWSLMYRIFKKAFFSPKILFLILLNLCRKKKN